MSNIIFIEKDISITKQMRIFLKEMDENCQVQEFTDLESFKNVYFPLDDENSKKKGNQKSQRLSTIDLIIFKVNEKEKDHTHWIHEVLKKALKLKYCSKEKPTRFIAIKYEDDDVKKHSLLHPLLDDIIFIPIDRLIFMQKVEIALKLPKKVTPSYLYNQKVTFNIEISKRSRIEELSQNGFSIINPVKLAPGAGAHFYANFNELNETLDFYAKVVDSKPSTKLPGQFLVRFAFFGLARRTAALISKYLNSKVEYRSFINTNENHFKLSDVNIFSTEDQKKDRNILIIDKSIHTSNSNKNLILENMDCVKVSTETSYIEFYKKYRNASAQFKDIEPATPFDISVNKILFTINLDSQELETCSTPHGSGHKFLDLEMKDFFSSPDNWKKFFSNQDAKSLLMETLQIFPSKERIEKLIAISNTQGEDRLFHFSFYQPQKKDFLNIEISPPDQQLIQKQESHNKRNPILSEIDLVIIDHRLIPMDFQSWWSNFNQFLMDRDLTRASKPPKLILTGDSIEGRAPLYLDLPVNGYFSNPVNSMSFLGAVSSCTENYFTKYNIDNYGCYQANITSFIAKPAKLTSLSEFGITLASPIPFKPGMSLYIHGGIYENAPDKNLCVRAYFSEEDEHERNQYFCYFTYFGINENFLKFIRNWIREKYAKSKNVHIEE